MEFLDTVKHRVNDIIIMATVIVSSNYLYYECFYLSHIVFSVVFSAFLFTLYGKYLPKEGDFNYWKSIIDNWGWFPLFGVIFTTLKYIGIMQCTSFAFAYLLAVSCVMCIWIDKARYEIKEML